MSSFNETDVRRGPGGKFAEKPPAPEAGGVELGEPSFDTAAAQRALDTDRDPRARFDETGPGGWGSYESEVTLGHETHVTDLAGARRVAPAGTKATLRTDFSAELSDAEPGSASGADPEHLRFSTYLEVDGVEYRPEDATDLSQVRLDSTEEQRREALEKIHTAMRYASRRPEPTAFSSVSESMSWQGTNPNVVVDYRLPETEGSR